MLIVLAAASLTTFVTASAPEHRREVSAFAELMSDVRTATERCPGVVIDDHRVAAEKERLHIGDVDYFAFRREAHDKADALTARFDGPSAVLEWCDDVVRRYGEGGTAVAGALHR